MKKIMLKKSVFSLLTFTAGAIIILSTSCSKNNEASYTPGNPESQMTAAVDNSNNSFTLTSSDGHLIGINGITSVIPDKNNTNVVTGCGSISGLGIQAICSNGVAFLYNGWTSGGGSVIALYINGQQFKDPYTGYGVWLSSVNGISVVISGGISAGQTYNDFVRTYCSNDTTNSTHYDSPLTTYVVPSTFLCSGTPPPPPTGGTTKKGHGK